MSRAAIQDGTNLSLYSPAVTISHMGTVAEEDYPITFRMADAAKLGDALKAHSSVAVVGMKRVGISNFLRFFLYHPQIEPTYIKNGQNLFFVKVDLNDLVEREIYPFWVLFLKRLVDVVEGSKMPDTAKQQARKLFTESIQLKDLFFTIDSVQKVLGLIIEAGFHPVVFLLRFDRLKDAATPEFFSNLQGVKAAAQQKLSFVITSVRPLHHLSPEVFNKAALSGFLHNQYIAPAPQIDMQTILDSFQKQYTTTLTKPLTDHLLTLAGGHVHFLQVLLLRLRDIQPQPTSEKELLELAVKDEEVILQSEEIFASLTKSEQAVLTKLATTSISDDERTQAKYLWDAGIVTDKNTLFSPIFDHYVKTLHQQPTVSTDFTKKEQALFNFLKKQEGELCEREGIIESVWPEQSESGVSDWAIDRLVARVRSKLKQQQSHYEIVTVITRGYKLVKKE